MAVALKSPKTTEKQWRAYVKSLEQGGPKSPKMEALRPFMGARGTILKRNTRSNKQRKAFNAAVKDIQKTYGRKTNSPFSKTQKQSETFAKNQAKKAVKEKQKKQHKKQTGEAKTKGLKKVAEDAIKKAEDKYSKMLDILMEGSQQLLSAKVRYEIYKKMDDENFSEEDIKAFIEKLLETLQDIPEEAKDLAKQDDYVQALMQLTEFSGAEKEDFNAMFYAMTGASADEYKDIKAAIKYWEENNNGMSFAQFWGELEMYNDKGEPENWKEILNNEED